MFSPTRSTFLLAPLAAVLTGAMFVTPAFAQGPDLSATYLGPAAKENFAFTWKEKGNFTRAVSRMAWEVPATELSTGGLDRNFGTYCAEALVGVVAGKTYRFEVQLPEVPQMYDLPDTNEGREEAARRAKYLRELYGRYYLGSIREDDPDATRAFQAAVWEILHESQTPAAAAAPAFTFPFTLFGISVPIPTPDNAAPAVPAPGFSLFSGNFQADYPNLAQSPLFVQRAEGFLQSLTGNENIFWQNLAGRELVRLMGQPGLAGEAAAQSQLALRYTRGGAAGFNGAMASAAPIGSGFPGLFGPGGLGGLGAGGRGFPGGLGSGGGFIPGLFGGGGSPSTIVPNVPVGATTSGGTTPPSSTTTPPGTVPPVNATTSSTGSTSGGPTSSTSSTGTSSGNVTTTSTSSGGAVPAPPGILLGVILLGALAGRRVLAQLKQAKDGEPPAG